MDIPLPPDGNVYYIYFGPFGIGNGYLVDTGAVTVHDVILGVIFRPQI